MQLKTRNIKALWMIGCLHYIISMVNALPTVEKTPQSPGTDAGGVFDTDQQVAPPTTADNTNSEDATSKSETAGSITDNAMNFPASSEASKSGTDDGSSIPLSAFNTMVPISQGTYSLRETNSVPTIMTTTRGNIGTGIPSNAILNTNLNQQASLSGGQLGNNGFLATVAKPNPSQISGRVMFSPLTMRNNMQRNMNMIPRPTSRATVVGPPTRTSSTFKAFQSRPGMTLPFVKPISSQSFTPRFSPTRNSPLPPSNFQTSFYSPTEPTFPITPFVRSGFSSVPFPPPSANTREVLSRAQTVTIGQPIRVTFSSPPATFARTLPSVSLPSPASVSFPPFISTSVGSSVPSNTFSSAPTQFFSSLPTVNPKPSTIILNNNALPNRPANPASIRMQSPPPPAQVTSFQPLPLMRSQSQISVTPFNLGYTPMSAPTSIPVSFAQMPTVVPIFAAPMPQATTNIIGGRMSPPPLIQQAGGFVPNIGGGSQLGGFVPNIGGGSQVGAGEVATAVGGIPGGGMFQANIPPVESPSLMASINEFLSPMVRGFQSL
ncbi:mucin-2-like [Pecten maximus]|uniref:mucin-2-like n=1 Tax=Pecten maximus TaxID=6579 RepID=UPI0014580D23|nr:mucin-2-like [Pecten maximus]